MYGVRSFGVLIAVLVGSLSLTAQAQDVAVEATVNETTVGSAETVAYTIAATGSSIRTIRTPEPPATEGLELLQTIPSSQRNMSLINGQMEQRIAFTWHYRPLRDGRARIGSATVEVDGEVYQTRAIDLTVVPQAQRPARPRGQSAAPFGQSGRGDDDEAERSIGADDLFIRAIPSRRAAYQGEQIVIEYQLFFRDGVQLRQSRLADAGDAEGFWREELDVDARPIPRTVVENGLRYNMITLKRVAVFPARSGELRIEPLRIQTEAFVPYNRGDPFERFFSLRSQYQPVDLASPPITIDVRPLPPGAPAGYDGAVGQFDMDVRVAPTDVEVGEAVEVRVDLTGTGNLATLEGPLLEPPGVFEQYDPNVTPSVNRTGQRVRGTKTFSYVLVPRSNGTFELPALTFAYFDPETERYETLQAPARTITVTGTAASPLATGTTAGGLPVDDIAGLMTTPTAWVRLGQTPLHRHPLAAAALLLPLLVAIGLYGYRRHADRLAADVGLARRRRAHPLARKHLKQAEALLQANEPHAFYDEVSRALQGFIGNRLNIAERGWTRTRLDQELALRQLPAEVRAAIRALLDECDQARFSPVLPDQAAMHSAADRAADLIVQLDRLLDQEEVRV